MLLIIAEHCSVITYVSSEGSAINGNMFPVVFYFRRIRIFEVLRCQQINVKRNYATEKKRKTKKYSGTIILPSTKFPVWIKSSERLSRDDEIAKVRSTEFLEYRTFD